MIKLTSNLYLLSFVSKTAVNFDAFSPGCNSFSVTLTTISVVKGILTVFISSFSDITSPLFIVNIFLSV